MRVRDCMTTAVVHVTPHARMEDAQARLHDAGLRCLPVVEAGRLVGLLLAGRPDVELAPASARAGDVMCPPCAHVGPDTTAQDAAVAMLQHDVRGLPVVTEDGTLLGVVTVSDVLDALVAPRDALVE